MIHKLLRYLMTLVALFAMTAGAWAEELTVSDGETPCSLPFGRSYLHCYQKNEMLFPADDLTAMAGQNITAIQFYTAQETHDFGGASFKVFLKEVNTTEFSKNTEEKYPFYEPDDATTTVYEGEFSVEDNKLTITFTTPYVYKGGNLLVGVYLLSPVNIPSSQLTFYGKSTGKLTYSSLRNDETVSLDAITTGIGYQSLPKTTFTYSSVVMNDDMTEAWFEMPAGDVTVEYTLARDLEDTEYPVTFSGIDDKLVVKLDAGSGKYLPITAPDIQLIDNITGSDVDIIEATGITVKVLKGTETDGEIVYNTTNPLTITEFLADAQPGFYKIVAEPTNDESLYIGSVSLELEVLTGYPVEVPAGGFITYYSDEALKLSDESTAGVLYTITNVSGNTATATEIPSANAGMPFIIRNTSDEKQTFLLVPTDDQINQAVYPGFKGTLDGKTFTAAEMADVDFYVVNNAQFVWVKDPGTIAAHRCWLEKTKNSAARSLNIVFGDATGITAVSGSPADNGDIYDLNGRKVQKPVKKGVYIQNGQKKVMK